MEWLNYHHLLYFYLVAREGTIAKAGKLLRLSQPTISGQIRSLEDALGEKLFERSGRTLHLTEVGRLVYRYADEIFSTGRELQDILKSRPTGRPVRLMVGVSDAVPKLVVHRVLEPALQMPNVRLVCVEDKTERLLGGLALQGLDLIVADVPIGASSPIKAFDHLLGESSISLFAHTKLARSLRGSFPATLEDAPMFLPGEGSAMRTALERWFEEQQLRPRVIAEFDDSALMKVFGERGGGVFPGPTIIEEEIRAHYHVDVVGRIADVKERFYAITIERRIRHPAVVRIMENAREGIFRAQR